PCGHPCETYHRITERAAPRPYSGNVASDINRRALHESLAVAAATILITGAGLAGVWTASSRAIKRDYLDHLTDLATVAALQLDADLHRAITRPDQLNDADYQRAVEPLRRMRLALPEVRYIYTMVRSADG